ncbi:MAG: PAS domain S-box protein [Anaerolineae bacterium]|nr:PAS domain S-box protein [Anaerolineae bacterium]
MGVALRVLILEDRPDDAELIMYELKRGGFDLESQRVDNEADFRAGLKNDPDIILADYSLPQWDAPRALRVVQEQGLDIPFIMLSGTVGEDVAVECMKQGAADYLLKDRLGRLPGAVTRALEDQRARYEKHMAVENLGRLHEFNQAIVQSVTEGIALRDADGCYTFLNPAAVAILGGTLDELIGRHWTTIFAPDQHEHVLDILERQARGETIRYEADIIRKGGERRTLWISGAPRYEVGEFVGTLAIFSDITERKQADEALVRERNLLRTLIDSMPDSVYAKDQDSRFILANRALAGQFHEPSPERLVGKSDFDYFRTEEAAAYRADELKVITTGEPLINKEEVTNYPDGKVLWLLSTKVPLRDSQGRIIGLVGNGRDITERKRADETLRRSEAKFRYFVEQSAEGIALIDEQGRVIEWNRSLEHMTGVSKAQVLGQPLWDVQRGMITEPFSTPLTHEQIKDGIQYLLSTGHDPTAGKPVESTLRRTDGELRYVQSVFFPIETDKGYMAGYVVVDVTERRRAAIALRQSEELMRYVVRHDPNAIAIFDTDMRYVAVSDRYLQDYNLNEADILGKRLYDVMPELPDTWRAMHQRCLQGAVERSDGDEPFVRADGSLSYVRWECRPWRWIDGKIGGLVIYSEATTERKLAELEILRLNAELEQRIIERTTELNHIKERVEAILNSSNDIIIMCRADGVIEQANPALHKGCQIEPEAVFHRALVSLVAPPDATAVTNAFRAVVETWTPERLEITVLRRDGGTFEADMILSPVIEHGERLLGVVCSLRDISERKLMEAQLRQMLKQAMDMSEMRARYVSMAAHDLGNPLAAIEALVTTIQMYGDRMTEAQKQAKFEEILSGVRVMADILSDVLTIGRVEGGQLKFTPAPLDLQRFCQSLITEILQATDSSRRIHFVHSGGCSDAYADSKLLRHIIGNLLSNAIKYSPVESEVSFSLDCTPDTATIRIRDLGIGIPEADKPRLFTAFHRAGNARQIPGTGLGLAIVKQSVELHGGSIVFESAQGLGTTFTVTLPTSKPIAER